MILKMIKISIVNIIFIMMVILFFYNDDSVEILMVMLSIILHDVWDDSNNIDDNYGFDVTSNIIHRTSQS